MMASSESEARPDSDRFAWMLEQRQTLLPAIDALAREPLPRAERQRLTQLSRMLSRDDHERVDGKPRPDFSGKEFTWLQHDPLLTAFRPIDSRLDHATAGTETDGNTGGVGTAIAEIAGTAEEIRYPLFRTYLIYPFVVFVLSILILAGLCLLVVPPFEKMFDEFALTLPTPTWVLFLLSHLLLSRVFWLGFLPLLIVFATLAVVRRWPTPVRLPIIGRFRMAGSTMELLAMSHFSQRLADLLAADVPLAEALRMAGNRCGHRGLESSAAMLAADSQRGWANLLHSPSAPLFPRNLVLAVAGDGGPSDRVNVRLLETLAALYRERANVRQQGGSTILGIVAVVFVAGLVGLIYLALMMPLVQLITGLT